MSESPPLHPSLEPLAALLGTWRGEGRGQYPTIEPFAYGEEVAFTHVGTPFLAYRQRTWSLATGAPLHAEAGYWRVADDGSVEVVMTHPFGAVEVYTGTVAPAVSARSGIVDHTRTGEDADADAGGGVALRLATRQVATTPTAKRIEAVERDVDVSHDGAALGYAVRMAAVGEPMTHHLSATLRRDGT